MNVADIRPRALRPLRRLVATVGVVAAASACRSGPPPTYTPHDAALRGQPLLFYPAAAGDPAKAFIVFLGNDIGFWEPHQELSFRLSKAGYDVVGLDLKKFLASLPSSEPQRDSAFDASIGPLIARARRELGADSLPVIVGGHSFGAEVAFWIALHHPPPGLVGVLAMSTRSTGHLFVTPFDLMNREASGPWSFSTIHAAAELAPSIRIADVRGAHDKFEVHDSAFALAGGSRFRLYRVPWAGHSLRALVIAGPIVQHAVSFLMEGADARRNAVLPQLPAESGR